VQRSARRPLLQRLQDLALNWSKVLKLWTALAACYVLAAVLLMGERGGKLRPLVNPNALYEVNFHGTVGTFN
jgi:hypothetical protein